MGYSIVRGPRRHPDKWGYAVACPYCDRIIQAPPHTDEDRVDRKLKSHVANNHAPELAAERPGDYRLARGAIHSECNHRAHPCPCRCNCVETVQCDCWSPYCSVCYLKGFIREDDDHGPKLPVDTVHAVT